MQTTLLNIYADGFGKARPLQAGTEASGSADASSRSHSESETLTSADAYMLMYIRRGDSDKPGLIALGDPVPMKTEKDQRIDDSADVPEQLRLEILQINNDFEAMCWEYTRRLEEELSRIAERKKEVRSILALAPAKSLEDTFWISTEWLRSWADSLTPP